MKYHIKVSDRPEKKYVAIFSNGKRVYFGAAQYAQYKDKTPLKKYSHMDHLDKNRRAMYRARHEKILTKSGKPAYRVLYSPSWFSYNYLW